MKLVIRIAVTNILVFILNGCFYENQERFDKQNLNSDLLVSYSFDEASGATANNSENESWNGLLNGVGRIDSPNGQAINFSMSTSSIEIDTNKSHVSPSNLPIDKQQITIEAFVRISTVSEGDVFTILGSDYSNYHVRFQLVAGKPEFSIIGRDGVTNNVISSSTVLGVNQWYHLVLTYNGSESVIYIDGQMDTENSIIYTLPETLGSLNIGGSKLTNYYFLGDIDEFRLHNIALTSQQVINRYDSLNH